MNISKKVTNILVEENIIRQDDKEVYEYCINALFDIAGNIFVTVILGIFLGKLSETILFLAAVIPLRSFAGGFHAKTSYGCLILSVGYYLASIYLPVIYINSDIWMINVIYCIASVIVYIISPVASVNKPVSSKQRPQMRRFAGITLIIVAIFYIFTCVSGLKVYSVELCVIVTILLISQLFEMIRGKSKLHSY